MKKLFLGILFISLTSTHLSAQWLDGGRKQSQAISANGDLLVDGGVMYFYNEDNMMQKSTDNGSTWIDLSDSGLPPKGPGLAKSVSIIQAAGGRIYAPMNYGSGGGMVFYSTDKGETWLMDTLGAPGQVLGWGGLPIIRKMHVWGHWLFISWDGPQMYDIKTFDGAYTRDSFMVQGINNPSALASHGDTLFVLAGTKGIYYTVDGGHTHVTPANKGYTGNLPKQLIRDGSRLYATVHSTTAPKVYTLLYTDDNGENWSQIDISAATNRTQVNGSNVTPIATFIKGNRIEMSFEQAAFNMAPNVWRSTDLGKTWSTDTLGLPNNYAEGVTGFAYTSDGNLWAVRGHENIYKQKIDAGSTGKVPLFTKAEPIVVMPNPCSDHCIFTVEEGDRSFLLFDMLGRIVRSELIQPGANNQTINVGGLTSGSYNLVIRTNTGEIKTCSIAIE